MSSAFKDQISLMGRDILATHYKFSDGKEYIELKEGEQGIVLNKEEFEHLMLFVKKIGWN